MNPIDLVVVLVIVLAVFNGWRTGFIVQLISLAGLVAGVWLAVRYGARAGQMLGLDADIAAPGGFAVVLVATVIAAAIAAHLLKALCRFAGFGVPDVVLGVALSLAKNLLLLGLLFSAFDGLNQDYTLIKPQTVEESRFYRPLKQLSARLFPFVEWVKEQIPRNEEA